MNIKWYVLLATFFLSTPSYSEQPDDEVLDPDPVIVAYNSCRNSLESVLSYYMNQPQAVRDLAERAIHCKCRQVAAAVESRDQAYESRQSVDADHPAYRDLLSEDQGEACLPPEL